MGLFKRKPKAVSNNLNPSFAGDNNLKPTMMPTVGAINDAGGPLASYGGFPPPTYGGFPGPIAMPGPSPSPVPPLPGTGPSGSYGGFPGVTYGGFPGPGPSAGGFPPPTYGGFPGIPNPAPPHSPIADSQPASIPGAHSQVRYMQSFAYEPQASASQVPNPVPAHPGTPAAIVGVSEVSGPAASHVPSILPRVNDPPKPEHKVSAPYNAHPGPAQSVLESAITAARPDHQPVPLSSAAAPSADTHLPVPTSPALSPAHLSGGEAMRILNPTPAAPEHSAAPAAYNPTETASSAPSAAAYVDPVPQRPSVSATNSLGNLGVDSNVGHMVGRGQIRPL